VPLPPFLSPTLPPAFVLVEPPLIPLPLSPTLPGAFQATDSRYICLALDHFANNSSPKDDVLEPSSHKRKRDVSPMPPVNRSAEPSSSKPPQNPSSPLTGTATPKKSVSLNEYKKRKHTTAPSNGPVTPTLSKVQPSYVVAESSPRQSEKANSETAKSKDDHVDAKVFAEKSQS
jgi:hypothetical protein